MGCVPGMAENVSNEIAWSCDFLLVIMVLLAVEEHVHLHGSEPFSLVRIAFFPLVINFGG